MMNNYVMAITLPYTQTGSEVNTKHTLDCRPTPGDRNNPEPESDLDAESPMATNGSPKKKGLYK
jgi:hypothetical protein